MFIKTFPFPDLRDSQIVESLKLNFETFHFPDLTASQIVEFMSFCYVHFETFHLPDSTASQIVEYGSFCYACSLKRSISQILKTNKSSSLGASIMFILKRSISQIRQPHRSSSLGASVTRFWTTLMVWLDLATT
jgi:hypothetical protein